MAPYSLKDFKLLLYDIGFLYTFLSVPNRLDRRKEGNLCTTFCLIIGFHEWINVLISV